jgi:hypothetical protein
MDHSDRILENTIRTRVTVLPLFLQNDAEALTSQGGAKVP